MDCQQAAELMPWYLNGTLDAAERAELEEHLGGCDVCRAELRETETTRVLFGGHPAAGLLVDYAFDRPEAPRDVVEGHLATCVTCAAELALVRDSQSQLDGERAPRRLARIVPLRPPAPRPRWRAAAVAAAVLGLIGAGGGLWSWRALDGERDAFAERQRAAEIRIAELEARIQGVAGPRLNVPIHDLWPDGSVLRSTDAGPARLPAEDGPAATLILNTQLEPNQAVARLEIRDGDGRVLQSLTDLRTVPGRSLTMSLALASLPRGKLQILLFGPDGSEPVESYTFELD